MEASGAGPAAANGGADAGGEAQADNGLSQITETLDSLKSSQEDLRDFLQSEPWKPEPAPAEPATPSEPAPLDLSFLDDPDLPPEELADRLTNAFDARSQETVQQAIAEALNPVREQLSEQQRSREAEALVSEFPDLADAETAEAVVHASRQWAEQTGQPELANSPALWRLVYMAGRAAEAANSESSPEGSAAHLEGAGGAGPAGGQQVDPADRIINAGGPRRVLPFG